MKKLIIAALLILACPFVASQTSSITGTIKALDNSTVTSGQITFQLKPGLDSTISGSARFIPLPIVCSITGAGAVKALDGVSTCTLTNNTSLSPSGTYYQACIQAFFISPGSCFNFYALGSTIDISTVLPTPGTSPAYAFLDTFSNQTVSGNKTFTGSTSFTGSLTFGSLNLASTGLLCWNSDSGITRAAAASFNLGTCAAGNSSGTLNLTTAALASAGVVKWSTDTGLSRTFAGVVAIGNSTQGNASGTLQVASVGQGSATTPFTITDNLGIAHFFLAGTSPFVNTFLQGNGSGATIIGTGSFAISIPDNNNRITFKGATSGTVDLVPTAVSGSTVLTLPATTGTIACTTCSQTLSATTLTSPIISAATINGTSTGTGIPTVTLKTGTGAGNYTTSSTSLVRVDTTNLANAVTIPTGWKLLINASGVVSSATAAGGVNIALADGTADNTGVLVQVLDVPTISGAGAFNAWTINWVVNGDGASHTLNLQFSTGNASDAAIMVNNTSTQKPAMTFLLTPSN